MGNTPFYLSRGVIGAVVSVVLGITALVMHMTTGQQTALQSQSSQITDWVVQGVSIIGGLVALYGRVKATGRITLGALSPPTTKEH